MNIRPHRSSTTSISNWLLCFWLIPVSWFRSGFGSSFHWVLQPELWLLCREIATFYAVNVAEPDLKLLPICTVDQWKTTTLESGSATRATFSAVNVAEPDLKLLPICTGDQWKTTLESGSATRATFSAVNVAEPDLKLLPICTGDQWKTTLDRDI